MIQRPAAYIIEVFHPQYGFIKFDAKKNQDNAEVIAEVVAKSRKAWFRVVHHGKVIAQFDCREVANATKV